MMNMKECLVSSSGECLIGPCQELKAGLEEELVEVTNPNVVQTDMLMLKMLNRASFIESLNRSIASLDNQIGISRCANCIYNSQ